MHESTGAISPASEEEQQKVRQAAGSQSLEHLQKAVQGWSAQDLDTLGSMGNGKSALHMAAWKGCFENVQFLVEDVGCDINAYSTSKYSFGKTAIFFALTQSRVEVVEYLLQRPDIFVAIVNNKGQSIRSLAASHDMPDDSVMTRICALEQSVPLQDWWNFRATHSDGLEYGDLDPRFLDRPLRDSDILSEHAVNLTSRTSRRGGFARRNPKIASERQQMVASKTAARKVKPQKARKQRCNNKAEAPPVSGLTEDEEKTWKDELETLARASNMAEVEESVPARALATLFPLGAKQRCAWMPQLIQAMLGQTTHADEVMINWTRFEKVLELTRHFLVVDDNEDQIQKLFEKFQMKVLQGGCGKRPIPALPRNPTTSKSKSKRAWNLSRNQARDLWVSKLGNEARQRVVELSIEKDLVDPASSSLRLRQAVRFIDNLLDLNLLGQALRSATVVAVDTEWMDDNEKAGNTGISTMQIAFIQDQSGPPTVYAIDLHIKHEVATVYATVAAELISNLLEDPATLVLGFSIGHDLAILEKFIGRKLQPTAILDIQLLMGSGTLGLKACVAKLSTTPLSKTEQCSDWSQRPLGLAQLHYAGMDAAILLYILAEYDRIPSSRSTSVGYYSSSSRQLRRRMAPSSSDSSVNHRIGEQRIAQVHKLLKGLETGDPASIEDVIHPDRYIQHNPQTNTDKEGLKELFARISKTNPHVNFVRSFFDGDYVFLHTEYDFATRRIGFEVFLFEQLLTVEHWDNIMPRKPAGDRNPSGRSMVDGATQVTDFDKTEVHRKLAKTFFTTVASGEDREKLKQLCSENLIQHNPTLADGQETWLDYLLNGKVRYKTVHRVLAQGNFCLCVSEGDLGDEHTAFYDLVRFEEGKVVEHWDTVEHVAPRETWKNENGKF